MPDALPLLSYEAPDPSRARYERIDSAGIEVVHNGAAGALGVDLLPVEEVLRIGAFNGEEEYLLDDVTAVVTAADGTTFVGSGRGAYVSVFDSTGAFVRRIGRKGDGPGEFRSVGHLWLAGDTLIAIDTLAARTTAFDRHGEVLAVWREEDAPPWHRPVARGPHGWIAHAGKVGGVERGGRNTLAAPQLPVHEVWTRFDPTTDEAGTELVRIAMPEQFPMGEAPDSHRDFALFVVPPAFAFDDRGRLFATSDHEYAIDVYDDGRRVRRIVRDFETVPVDEEAVRELRLFVDTFFARDAVLQLAHFMMNRRLAVRAELPRPPHVPPLGRLLVAADGGFWVERNDAVPAGQRDADRLRERPIPWPTRWDLFDADGRFLGTAETPPRFVAHHVNGLVITGVQRDRDMIEYVVKLRVTPPSQ